MPNTDLETLVFQMDANVVRLNKSVDAAIAKVDGGAGRMQKRMDDLGGGMFRNFKAAPEFTKALDRIFDSSRLAVIEEGSARLRVFGSALEPLGALGIGAAAGIGAVALATEAVMKAAEEIGDMSLSAKRLGIPVEELQKWQFVATASHTSTQELDEAMKGLSNTLGKLQSGIRDDRVKPFLDELKISDADLAKVRNAAELMSLLIQRMSALRLSAGEKVQIVEAFGGESAINVLSKTSEEVRGLTDDFRKSASVISGEQADAVERLNAKYDEAHAIMQSKTKADMVELIPLVRGLGMAWESVVTGALDAAAAMAETKRNFDSKLAEMANQKAPPDSGFGEKANAWMASAAGRVGWAAMHPLQTAGQLANPFGGGLSLGSLMNVGKPNNILGVNLSSGAAQTVRGERGDEAQGSEQTRAAAEKARKATEDFTKALDEYVNHTSHAAEMQKRIALDRTNGANISPQQESQLMAAARAQDAAPEARAASEAARKKAELARKAAEAAQKALEQTDKDQETIDQATEAELDARKALATNIKAQAAIEAQVLAATRDRALASLKVQADKGTISHDTANDAGWLVMKTFNERQQHLDVGTSDAQSKQSSAIQQENIQSQIAMLEAQGALATTTEQRKANALKLLDLQEQLEEVGLQEIINSKAASDADKQLAQRKLDDLRRLQPIKAEGVKQANGPQVRRSPAR